MNAMSSMSSRGVEIPDSRPLASIARHTATEAHGPFLVDKSEERDRAEARGRKERLDARVRAVADKGESMPAGGRMIGRSEPWQRVLMKALRVASTDTTVFLEGESGTGKEVVA